MAGKAPLYVFVVCWAILLIWIGIIDWWIGIAQPVEQSFPGGLPWWIVQHIAWYLVAAVIFGWYLFVHWKPPKVYKEEVPSEGGG